MAPAPWSQQGRCGGGLTVSVPDPAWDVKGVGCSMGRDMTLSVPEALVVLRRRPVEKTASATCRPRPTYGVARMVRSDQAHSTVGQR